MYISLPLDFICFCLDHIKSDSSDNLKHRQSEQASSIVWLSRCRILCKFVYGTFTVLRLSSLNVKGRHVQQKPEVMTILYLVTSDFIWVTFLIIISAQNTPNMWEYSEIQVFYTVQPSTVNTYKQLVSQSDRFGQLCVNDVIANKILYVSYRFFLYLI